MTLLSESTVSGSPKSKKVHTDGRRRPPICGRVLWVDDDPNVTAALTRRFRRKGVQIWPAADGMQGYWMAITRKPDVIVTDLRMPRWEGRDLLECLLLNNKTASVPLVVLSGYITGEERQSLERMGVAAVLDKPANWRTLFTTIRDLMRK